jgi:uncharacterized protein
MISALPDAFSTAVLRFATYLSGECGFAAAHAKAQDALRAAEIVGVVHRRRVRDAFRLLFCASPDEARRFDGAFDAFFTGALGIAQPNLPPRRLARRAGDQREGSSLPQRANERREDRADAATTWQALRARYSPVAGESEPPIVAIEGLEEMLSAADRLIARVRLGRSRRWKPAPTGPRFDVRRTLRASLQTGGDPIALHRLGPPPRDPRFVVLLDGSRSMAEHAVLLLQFAYALCRRSRRAHAFVFSTSILDVTRALRAPERAGTSLDGLGTAWGGGTRIGAALSTIIRTQAKLLTPQTLVFIASDGLDVGDIAELERAMRTLRSTTAGVVWLHPHANTPGFRPAAAGIRTALPYLSLLAPGGSRRDFVELPSRVRL